MANVTITQLPQAGAITGQELVPVVQNGQTVQTTTAAISASPSQNQTFITVNQEPTLANSRSLSGSTGVGLVDGGAQSNIEITLNGVSGSLESSNVGLIAKTGGSVTGRQIVAGTAGVQITNGNGVSGNPSIELTGPVGALAGLSGVGILGLNGSTVTGLTILGTTSQINVANGTGTKQPNHFDCKRSNATRHRRGFSCPVVQRRNDLEARQGRYDLTPTPALWSTTPGRCGLIFKQARQLRTISPVDLQTRSRFKKDQARTTFITAPTVANTFLEWSGSAFQWSANPLGTVTSIDVSGGTTGLTYSGGPITSAGTITMAGTLITTNGGTGLSSYTAGDITYYAAGTALSKLAIGASTFILTSTGTAPQWSDPAGISVNTATNIAGGGANQIVFNTASGTTSFITANGCKHLLRVVRKRLPMGYPLGNLRRCFWRHYGLTTSGGPVTTSGTITLAGTLAVANGGTGQTSYINGELLIGNTTGNTLTKATLTAGTGISITNGTGSITIAAINNGTVTSVDASGGTTGMSFSGGPITTSGTLTLAGTLAVANGGTGQTSYADGELLIGNSSGNTLSKATLTAGSNITITNGNGSITIASTAAGGTVTSVDVSGGTTGLTTSGGPVTTSGTMTIAGTLITSNGGTGLTSYTAGDLLYYATGTALSALGLGTQGQVLKAGASAPEWGAVDGGTFT
jgi:hypothetical protein